MTCGDVQLNPGSRWKNPCAICSKPVLCNQRGIQCDGCLVWHHTKCNRIIKSTYDDLANLSCAWFCADCDQLNFSFCFSGSNLDSISTSNSFSRQNSTGKNVASSTPVKDSSTSHLRTKKKTVLRCKLINCQSIKSKKADLELAIDDDHKPDILMGTESSLTSDIYNSDIFPSSYSILRKDDRLSNTHGGSN